MLKTRSLAEALYRHSVKTGGKDSDKIAKGFVEFMKRHHMENSLPKVMYHLENIFQKQRELDQCTVTTAHDVSAGSVKELTKNLLNKDHVEVETNLDKDLIGGFILKHNGIIFDGSLKTKLNLLENNLSA